MLLPRRLREITIQGGAMQRKEPLTGSQQHLRDLMMKCECGITGDMFTSNGEFFSGHMCKISGAYSTKKLPSIPEKDLYELYDRLHHIGIG